MAGRAREGAVRTVVQAYEELRKEWAKKNRNLQTCGKYLSDIKASRGPGGGRGKGLWGVTTSFGCWVLGRKFRVT